MPPKVICLTRFRNLSHLSFGISYYGFWVYVFWIIPMYLLCTLNIIFFVCLFSLDIFLHVRKSDTIHSQMRSHWLNWPDSQMSRDISQWPICSLRWTGDIPALRTGNEAFYLATGKKGGVGQPASLLATGRNNADNPNKFLGPIIRSGLSYKEKSRSFSWRNRTRERNTVTELGDKCGRLVRVSARLRANPRKLAFPILLLANDRSLANQMDYTRLEKFSTCGEELLRLLSHGNVAGGANATWSRQKQLG